MKTRRTKLAAVALAAALGAALLFASCGGGGSPYVPPPPPAPLTIDNSILGDAVVGNQYNQYLSASGGTAPYTWSVTSGSLPAGLTLSSTGMIGGKPTAEGNSQFAVEVHDSASHTASATFALTAVTPLVTASSLSFNATLNQTFSRTLLTSGGTPLYVWSMSSGHMPSGITLSSEGVLSGTPTEEGSFIGVFALQDSGKPPQWASVSVAVRVWRILTIPSASLPFGVVTHLYHAQAEAFGGAPPYTWSITSGSLPPGLTLNPSTGEISGMPTQVGTFQQFQLTVSDSSTPPQIASLQTFLTIKPIVFISATRLDDGIKDWSYGSYIIVFNGQPPYTLSLMSGTLPAGLSLNQGTSNEGYFYVSGTPTALGTYSFSVRATDSSIPSDTVTRDESIRINERLVTTTTSLPLGLTGDPYDAIFGVTGGVQPYSYALSNRLPKGVTFDSAKAEIFGTPTEPFDEIVYFNAMDSSQPMQWAYANLELKIVGRLAVATSRLPATRPGAPYRVSLNASGGTAPYTWSIASGVLPSGLNLSPSTGQMTGTPTTEGTSNFTVQVTDTGPPVQTASKALSLTIKNDLGRNDTISTATPISNGTYRASISPYSDPPSGPANPDSDYYELTAAPGSMVTIETMADRLVPASPLDTVIEILDSSGNRFSACRLGNDNYSSLNQPCVDDDLEQGVERDSRLQFAVPTDLGSGPVTFYVHVLDWSGSARPDYIYDLVVSGAN